MGSVHETSAERGFTLIELMMVVAIIAVLAIIVVPLFTREVHKTKGQSEVNPMFTELGTKEETYKQEAGSFLGAVQCPAAASPAGYDIVATCKTSGSAWESLRVQAPNSTMHCAYTIVVGLKTDTLTPPTGIKNSAGVVSAAEANLATSWWYMTAECDEDGQGGTNALYYRSSVDPTLQILNSGS
jgi:type IV pilus assembly protein PilE